MIDDFSRKELVISIYSKGKTKSMECGQFNVIRQNAFGIYAGKYTNNVTIYSILPATNTVERGYVTAAIKIINIELFMILKRKKPADAQAVVLTY